MHAELANYPEIELVLQEAGQTFQVQFRKTALEGTKQGPSRDQVGTKQGPSRDQVDDNHLLTSEHSVILKSCKTPLSIAELMKIAGRSNRTKFRKSIINPLLRAGLLEMTEPDSPKSPTQKYRTTEKGQEAIKDQKGD